MSIVMEKQYVGNLRYNNELFSTKFPNAMWVDIRGTSPLIAGTIVEVDFGKLNLTRLEEGQHHHGIT